MTAISALSASISPLSASILAGQSVAFTSTVSGGYTPYSCQWYLNGVPVSGATSVSWTFTPAMSGIYYIYLRVTDAEGNTTQSEITRIRVAVLGDIDNNGIVDIFDIAKAVESFGSKEGDAKWNPAADINNDNIVDLFDLVIVAIHFGETG